jgi:hypothetical protein
MTLVYARKRAAPTQTFLLGMQALGFGGSATFALLHPSYVDAWLWVLVALCGLAGAIASVLAAWHVFGEETVDVGGGAIRVRRRIGPFWRERTISLVDVLAIEVLKPTADARFNDAWGFGQPRVRVAGNGRSLQLALAASPDEATALAASLRDARNLARAESGMEAPSNNEMQRTKPAQAMELRR